MKSSKTSFSFLPHWRFELVILVIGCNLWELSRRLQCNHYFSRLVGRLCINLLLLHKETWQSLRKSVIGNAPFSKISTDRRLRKTIYCQWCSWNTKGYRLRMLCSPKDMANGVFNKDFFAWCDEYFIMMLFFPVAISFLASRCAKRGNKPRIPCHCGPR